MISQIDFWRKVVGLLKRTTKYPSPFRNANFSWHIIHPPMTIEGKKIEPDLVSTKKQCWIILDLTLNPEKNWHDFKKTYGELSTDILAEIASPHYSSEFNENPNLLVFGSKKSVSKTKCKKSGVSGLSLIPDVEFFPSSESLTDDELKKELERLENEDLSNPPTSILAVPEMEGDELRTAIKGVLLSYAQEESNKFNAEDIAGDLLLNEKGFFSRESRKTLNKKVRKMLIRLRTRINEKGDKKWLTFNQSKGTFTLRYLSHPQSFKKFERLLTKWCNNKGEIQESMESFQDEISEEESLSSED